MRSWILAAALASSMLGWSAPTSAQSVTLSATASSYQAPATFNISITTVNGTGSNKYKVQGGTLVLTRNNQVVHTGTAAYAETALPVGTYAYKATATAFNPVTLHEYLVTSNTVNITVTAPPAPSGTVLAAPNPCNIAMGSTTCSVTISWSSNNGGATVWASNLDNTGMQQFAAGQSGAQAATWITAAGTRFHLKVGGQTLDTVDVLGNAPPPPSGTITASPNPCTIAPGGSTCLVTATWSSVNAPTATVWVSDLSNNGMAPFGNAPSGSQGTVLPASTGKRLHLKFGSLTLHTLDIQAGPIPPPAGTLTASASNCSIAIGNVACPLVMTWSTTNPTARITLRMSDPAGNGEALFASGPSGSKSVPIVATGMRFQLLNGTQVLASVNVGATAPPVQPSVAYRASKTETIEYQDVPARWVMGLPKRLLVNGIEVSRTTYDPASVLPLQTYAFGKLQQTLTYDLAATLASGQRGTVKTVADGKNNVTTLSNWYRGTPRNILYADATTQSAAVNANGWITSVTDENGFATNYGYDVMGRLASIVYPTGDTTGWNSTAFTWEYRNIAEHGLPAGHWLRSQVTGTGTKDSFLDARYRPVLVHEYDSADKPATLRATRTQYDASGRMVFQSYPSSNAVPAATGTWTLYDGLDRVLSVSQDSELGLLTTTTQYLNNFQTRVTNPRTQSTTTDYLVYDQPVTDWPITIAHPDGVFTDINRHLLGYPLSITRRNAAGNVAITRSYVYNSYRELCKQIEPETKSTVMHYDAAGNLEWTASGLDLPDPANCQDTDGSIAARRISRTYDARNRVEGLSFPDGRGNTVYTYTADGLPSSVLTANGAADGQTSINYGYNKRRLMTSETLVTPEVNWPVSYIYNGNGHLASQTWHGLTIGYAPNGLGQPTQAGTYATGVSYHPNGAIKQFTYGNGIVHSMVQNARLLPARSTDTVAGSTPLDMGYTYDNNANVAAITDYVAGARQTRSMGYDNLDRLTQATSSMFGTASYGYNALDNLTTVNVTGGSKARNQAYVYDPSNRLVGVTAGGSTVVGLGYDVQGNLANKNGVLHSFDFGNRLRTVTDPVNSRVSTYAYDGQGRRVKDVVNGAAKHSQYANNGQLVLTSDASTVDEYVYLQGSLLAIRSRDIATSAYTTKYQHTDALGTPIAVTSQSRVLLETSEYEPFGQQVNVVGAAKNGPGYTGHVQEAATGLIYMQQRYYDPIIGRFLSVDPVTANSGTGANFNRYWYANNNPYRFFDPDGRQSCTVSKSGKTMICDPEVKGMSKVSIPMPKGFPGRIDASQKNGHRYDKQVSAGPGTAGKTKSIQQSNVADPTPGIDRPATPAGTRNNATPDTGACCKIISVDSPVISYSVTDKSGNTMVINVTLPGHPLHPGVVMRGVVPEGGEAVSHNVGIGTGILQSNEKAGDFLFNNVWYKQSEQNIKDAK